MVSFSFKEVKDKLIWTIELCHIWNFYKHFFNRTLFLATANAMLYSNTFLRQQSQIYKHSE
jgi:hypothetical protein